MVFALPVLVSLSMGLFPQLALAVTESVEQAYQRFIAAEDAMTNFAPSAVRDAMHTNYVQTMAPYQAESVLPSLSATDIDLIFRASYDMAFYTFDRRHVEDMQSNLAVLQSRGADEPRHYQDLYESWVRVRDFRAAETILAGRPHAGEDRAPAVAGQPVEGLGPSALVLSADGTSARQHAIVLSEGIDIVVIGHPHCHFSVNAVAAIEGSTELKALFQRHARWLMPQDGRMKANDVALWNAKHQTARMSYIYREQDWPAIDTWSTPTFYFFRRGVLVDKQVGWGPDGEKVLRSALEKLGLLQ